MDTDLRDLTRKYTTIEAARAYTVWTLAQGAASPHNGVYPIDIVKHALARNSQLAAIEKSAAALTTGTAGVDYLRPLSAAWSDLVRRQSVLGRMGGAVRRVPPLVDITTIDAGVTASFVAEGQPTPIAAPTLADTRVPPCRLSVGTVISRELFRASADRAALLVERDLSRAIGVGEDTRLLDRQAAVTGERPASVLYGLSPVGGGSPSDIEADAIAVLAAVRGGDAAAPFFVASPAGIRYLLAQRDSGGARRFPDVTALGGSIYGVPLLPSTGCPDLLACIDADAVLLADEDVQLRSSSRAAVEQSLTPAGAGSGVVSIFQTNSLAVLADRHIGWRLAWADGAAFCDLPLD